MSKMPSPPVESATEQRYFELWSDQLAGTRSPTVLAELGGRLADRAAWVFVAGYQGALRQCFPTLTGRTGWASYLVSEAREDKSVPTCHLHIGAASGTDDGMVLDGTKNWVAASAHLQTLVVNAAVATAAENSAHKGVKDGADVGATKTANVLVDVASAGVALIEKPSGRFLPELVVGRAEFKRANLSKAACLEDDDTFASLFGLIEARCLLVALAGHFSQLAPEDSEPAESLLLSGGLVTAELATKASIEILLESMDLLVEWFEGWHNSAQVSESAESAVIRQRWSDDQRLLQMHRPLLAKQLKKIS